MTKPKVVTTVSYYLDTAFNRPEMDKRIQEVITPKIKKGFDTIIGTGLSGALTVPHIANTLDKVWAIVRKDNDNSHGEWSIEGSIGQRWIFADDFISSGATLGRVIDAVDKHITEYNNGWRVANGHIEPAQMPVFAGVFEYQKSRFTSLADMITEGSSIWIKSEVLRKLEDEYRAQNLTARRLTTV